MLFFTGLGYAAPWILLLVLLYWCIDEKKSLMLGTTLCISIWINLALKFIILNQGQPILNIFDPAEAVYARMQGGFPSGQVQHALIFWMILASWLEKKWPYAIAVALSALVGFACIQLGLHSPVDVAVGTLIGMLILCIYFLVSNRLVKLLEKTNARAGLIACAVLAFGMILYRPTFELLMPAGFLLGLGSGYFICQRHIGLSAAAIHAQPPLKRFQALLIRGVTGTGLTIVLYMAMERLTAVVSQSSAPLASNNAALMVFLSYALLALWVSAGAPWFFRLFLHFSSAARTKAGRGNN